MKRHYLSFILVILFIYSQSIFSQFNDYRIKYGIQNHFLLPQTEFTEDSYRLSLLGRGFLRVELNSFLETEFGFGIGNLNGKDFLNDNWGTSLFPADARIIISPIKSFYTNPYLYSGISMLRWKLTDTPKSISPRKSRTQGWNVAFPFGAGIEILLNEDMLLEFIFGYTISSTDDLNFYNSPDSYDGFFNLGVGLTFVIGGSLSDDDKDGLIKKIENEIGTDFTKKDTDLDNLSDGDEVKIHRTNPLKSDSDNDGLNDFDEIMKYNTDPNSSDTDGDDILDLDEIFKFKTDPNKKDTDSDNIFDGYELNIYGTDPLRNDSDSDKLYDNDEIQKYNTDPMKSDTDGDGIADGIEIMIDKTDALNNSSYKKFDEVDDKIFELRSDKPMILRGISFELDKKEIRPGSESILDEVFQLMKKNPSLQIEIKGYTDNTGEANYNLDLSQQRANEVKIWLVKKGIDALRITSIGLGELYPIADNNTEEGRKLNRRIEIIKINK